MPFTKGESTHYLEQISYHTLMFTKETHRERGQERIDFPGEEIAMRTSNLDQARACLNKKNTQ